MLLVLTMLTAIPAMVEATWVEINQSNSHLMGNTGYGVFEDSDGLTWWLCSQGVCVYDEDIFVTEYTTSDMGDDNGWIHANGMCEDSNGDKYISIEGGIAKFDGNDWTLYTPDNSPIQDLICTDITVGNDGLIWSTNQRGVVSLDPEGNWTTYDGSNTPMNSGLANINKVLEDSSGKLWFLGNDTEQHSGLISFDGTNWQGHLVEGVELVVTWMDMCITNEDVLWLAGMDGLYSYDIATGQTTNYNQQTVYDKITACLYDPLTGDIWAGMLNNEYASMGAVKFDGTEWTHYPVINGPFIAGANIYGISTDSSGSIWFSQYTEGFVKYVNDTNVIENVQIPENVIISQNYPNPFNPSTTIAYSLAEDSHVELSIYDVKGKKVKTLVSGKKQSGQNSVNWNGLNEHSKPVSSGIYFYKIIAGSQKSVKQMVLLK